MNSLGVDVQPTTVQLNAIKSAQVNAAKAMAQWTALRAGLNKIFCP